MRVNLYNLLSRESQNFFVSSGLYSTPSHSGSRGRVWAGEASPGQDFVSTPTDVGVAGVVTVQSPHSSCSISSVFVSDMPLVQVSVFTPFASQVAGVVTASLHVVHTAGAEEDEPSPLAAGAEEDEPSPLAAGADDDVPEDEDCEEELPRELLLEASPTMLPKLDEEDVPDEDDVPEDEDCEEELPRELLLEASPPGVTSIGGGGSSPSSEQERVNAIASARLADNAIFASCFLMEGPLG